MRIEVRTWHIVSAKPKKPIVTLIFKLPFYAKQSPRFACFTWNTQFACLVLAQGMKRTCSKPSNRAANTMNESSAASARPLKNRDLGVPKSLSQVPESFVLRSPLVDFWTNVVLWIRLAEALLPITIFLVGGLFNVVSQTAIESSASQLLLAGLGLLALLLTFLKTVGVLATSSLTLLAIWSLLQLTLLPMIHLAEHWALRKRLGDRYHSRLDR